MELNTNQIVNNAAALQMLLHALCKSPSHSDQEFNLKYDVYEVYIDHIQKLMKSYNRYGYGAQALTFGGLTYYCLKTNGARSKLALGFLYVYWINHFFTIGSFVGVTFSLPWALKHLNQADEGSTLKQQLQQINRLIVQRKDESDSELNNMFYTLRVLDLEVPNRLIQGNKKTQLVENDFFEKHPEYVPSVLQENPKLQYCDYFLTRFVYFTFTRWLTRVGQWSGIIQ